MRFSQSSAADGFGKRIRVQKEAPYQKSSDHEKELRL